MNPNQITPTPVSRVHSAWSRIAALFAIDLRSLAAFRIAAAGVLLLDLWYRGHEITAYFSDDGVLPRTARIELSALGDEFGFQHQWSLHLFSGETWAQLALMLLAAMFAGWLLVGYRTRLAAVASWILLMSLDGRNPVVLNSGDVLLRCMLLWSLFLPLGARFSIDAWRTGKGVRLPTQVVSMASAAVLLQLCMMYWFSAVFKFKSIGDMPSPWLGDYSAVYYALNCDAFATRFGIWLRQFPTVMQWLTASSLWLEILGPLLVFSPWLTKCFRGGVITAFVAFHVGLSLCLTIGIFPLICIISWLVFLPAEFWDWVETSLPERWLKVGQRLAHGLPSALFANHETPAFRRRWLVEAGVACLLVYVALWNLRETDFKYWEPRLLPRSWNAPARILGLDQNWSMFAPLPRTEDGWLVMEGTLRDGSTVNLWEFDEPLPWAKPPLVSATYHTQRWRKYLDNLTTDSYAAHRMYFCEWLARRWNEQQAEGLKTREVHKVELSHRIELTPPPGEPMPDPETRVLWTWYFE
ncbi:MAG: HTTM domain-containing protein [Planctomycetota bacterium]